MNEIIVKDFKIGNKNPLVLISGPCVLEEERTILDIAEKLKRIAEDFEIPLVFKSSYEKDNRSTVEGYRGPGLQKGLSILRRIKEQFDVPVISDIHRETDVELAGEVLDIMQIPAFLCQQTSLLIKAGQTKKPINVKKGQSLAPENMKGPVSKILSTGNSQILLTERGTSFGYNRLVSDICSIPIMQGLGFPVVYDSTHIIRVYGIPSKDKRGGTPQFIGHLTKSGVAAGCDAIFLETHTNPESALCDAASMLRLDSLPQLLEQVIPISEIVRKS